MSIQETLTRLQQEALTVQEALKNFLDVSKQTSESTQQLLEEEFSTLLTLRDCSLDWEKEQDFSQRQALFYDFMRLLTQAEPDIQHIYFEILFMKRLTPAKHYPLRERHTGK